MKLLKLFSLVFVLLVVLLIPVSAEKQEDDIKKDNPLYPIVKKVREYCKVGKFEEALNQLNIAKKKSPQKEYRKKLEIELADVHYWWAANFYKKHDFANAIKYLEMAYAIDKIYRPKKAADDLNKIAISYFILGSKRKALEYSNKSLLIRRAVNDRFGEAESLMNIATVYSNLSKKHKALEYYEKALKIYQVVGHRSRAGTVLTYIGTVYNDLGQKRKAFEYYEKALPIHRAVGNRTGTALTLTYIGRLYDILGQKNKSLEYYKKALSIFRKTGNRSRTATKDRVREATTLTAIGLVYSHLGQNYKALDYLEKALLIIQELKDRSGKAMCLGNIGIVYSKLGQYHKSLEYFEKALFIHRAVGDRSEEAATLGNIGRVYSTLGQKHKALAYYEKALPLRRAVGNRSGEALILSNIGRVYSTLGQKHKALAYYEKALPIRRAIGDRSGEARTLTNIGLAYNALGQKHKALKYYEEALPISQASGERNDVARELSHLMVVWKSLKNQPFSIFYGKQSVNIFQNLREYNSKFKRNIKKTHLGITKNTYRYLADVLTDGGRIPEAQHVLDMLKEKEYFEFTRKDQSNITTYSKLDFTDFEKLWLDKYKQVTKEYYSTSGDYYLLRKKKAKNDEEIKRLKEFEASLGQHRKDYDQYLTELEAAFTKYNKTVKKGMIKTPKTQKRLRERQETLKKLDKKEGGKNVFLNFLVQDERIAVIFTTPDYQFVRFCNVNKKKLNRLIIEYRNAIETRSKAPQKEMNNDSAIKTIYGKLYDAIFKPVDVELKKMGATNLMVYLDGLLRYISLPVLWDGENYLIQRYRISRFTSASFDRIKQEPEAINNILGLGASRGGEGFEPLPNVKEEIQGIVKDTGKGFNGVIQGKAFLDNDFTRETFVNQLKTAAYPLIHISSHFSFNSGGATPDETKSHLLMGDGTKMNLKEIREHKGLFKGVELLMLSACETGRGDADGQEIDGFGELAQQSGAQAVVASLWKVRDESTKELMVKFYRILKRGNVTSKIEALRQAQLELAGLDDLLGKNSRRGAGKKSKYSHPYYWGPFIMIGNWR